MIHDANFIIKAFFFILKSIYLYLFKRQREKDTFHQLVHSAEARLKSEARTQGQASHVETSKEAEQQPSAATQGEHHQKAGVDYRQAPTWATGMLISTETTASHTLSYFQFKFNFLKNTSYALNF